MARRRARVRPGRIPSLLSFLVGIAFVIIGLLAVIPMAGPFGLLWTAAAAGITVVNGINAFGKKGVASMEIETEEQPGDTPPAPAEPDIRERLERLEQLKELEAAGLITVEEYEKKREEILREL